MSLRLSGGRRLQSPPGLKARPTPSRVRLAVMNLLASRLEGCAWLDLFSGSGVMACEALQHGAARVVAVERDRRNALVVRANLDAVAAGLAAPELRVHPCEVLGWLRSGWPVRGEKPFDLIYADPPYSAGLHGPVADAVAHGEWLSPGGLLLLECATSSVPPTPDGWHLSDQRRYGTSTVLLLEQGTATAMKL
jgi:16S rRNA (guanine966-N2)-methyltransferase